MLNELSSRYKKRKYPTLVGFYKRGEDDSPCSVKDFRIFKIIVLKCMEINQTSRALKL
jgi:hypothetical protein